MKMVIKSVLSVLILLFSVTGFSQNKDKQQQPNEDYKVNKEYDEDGNLVRYDSTYVYTWSSDSSMHFMPDSTFFNHPNIQEMRKRMQEQMQQFFGDDSTANRHFEHPFFSEDFFNYDFFDGDFKNNDFFKEMEKMMEKHMNFRNEHNIEMHRDQDSLHNDFMEKQKRYFQQRDSLYRKHNNKQDSNTDI